MMGGILLADVAAQMMIGWFTFWINADIVEGFLVVVGLLAEEERFELLKKSLIGIGVVEHHWWDLLYDI